MKSEKNQSLATEAHGNTRKKKYFCHGNHGRTRKNLLQNRSTSVIPAKAGIQSVGWLSPKKILSCLILIQDLLLWNTRKHWIPAFAGMTPFFAVTDAGFIYGQCPLSLFSISPLVIYFSVSFRGFCGQLFFIDFSVCFRG